MAIYLITVDGTKKLHLADIPRVCSGKAKDDLEAIEKAINDWRVEKTSIIGLVFDTTTSNTGEWSAVCRRCTSGLAPRCCGWPPEDT